MISETKAAYGSGLIEQLSKDLSTEFPDMKGFSYRNLAMCRQFYQFYTNPILQQPVAELEDLDNEVVKSKNNLVLKAENQREIHPLVKQIPWGHNTLIFSKSKSLNEAHFYIHETIENGWSRDILALQIKSNLFQRQEPNTLASKEITFNGVPAGYRHPNGSFYEIGNYAYWWSSNAYNTSTTWTGYVDAETSNIYMEANSIEQGFSIRCLKN